MSPFQIAVIVGSLRRDSFNRKLATAMGKIAPADFTYASGNVGPASLGFIKEWIAAYTAWVRLHAK